MARWCSHDSSHRVLILANCSALFKGSFRLTKCRANDVRSDIQIKGETTMTRYTLVLAATIAAVSFSTFATAQTDSQNVVPATIEAHTSAQERNRIDQGSDVMQGSRNAVDDVAIAQRRD